MYGKWNVLYRWFCACVLFIFCGLAPAIAAEPVAMVTDLEGKATLADDARKPALSILSEIKQDSRVQLENGARAIVVYLESGQEYEFKGPAVIQFGSSQPESISGAKPQLRGAALAKGGKEIRIKPVVVAQAAIVMRAIRHTSKIKLLSLAGTKTLEPYPVFLWQALQPGLRYSFKLIDDAGKVLFDASVEGTALQLPPQVHLKEAMDYTWMVSARLPDGKECFNAGDFSVAPDALREQAESLRPAENAPLSERVAFAAWLEQVNLKDEARKYWKSISSERQDDQRLKVMAEE